MNEILNAGAMSDVPWPTHAERLRVPNTSMLPASEAAPTAPAGLLKNAAQLTRDAQSAWAERLRCTVRNQPLAALAAALAVGMVVARIVGRQR